MIDVITGLPTEGVSTYLKTKDLLYHMVTINNRCILR